jgi:hypothetical protein
MTPGCSETADDDASETSIRRRYLRNVNGIRGRHPTGRRRPRKEKAWPERTSIFSTLTDIQTEDSSVIPIRQALVACISSDVTADGLVPPLHRNRSSSPALHLVLLSVQRALAHKYFERKCSNACYGEGTARAPLWTFWPEADAGWQGNCMRNLYLQLIDAVGSTRPRSASWSVCSSTVISTSS